MEDPKTASDQIVVPKTVLKRLFDDHFELLTKADPGNIGGFGSEDCKECGAETIHIYDPRGTGWSECLHCIERHRQ